MATDSANGGPSDRSDRQAPALRVLVTGAAGFIGSHLCDRLLADGTEVWGIDNFDPFYSESIKRDNIATAAAHPGMHLIEGDIRDEVLLSGLLRDVRFDAVVHLAARPGVRPSIEDPEQCIDINVGGTLTLLEAMRRRGVRRLLFGSSSSVYGETDAIPLRESAAADKPISPYAASKRAGEQLCYTYHHLFDFSIHCLRFFTVFGPRQRPDLAIHKFTRLMARGEAIPVYGDGTSARDYTYISDTVEGLVRSLAALCAADTTPSFEIINLGRSDSVTLRDLVTQLGAALGIEPRIEWLPMQPGDVTITCASGARAQTMLGFEPQVDFVDGLARFVAWYRERQPEQPVRATIRNLASA